MIKYLSQEDGIVDGTYTTKIFKNQKTKCISVFSAHKIKGLKAKLEGEDENVPQSKLTCGVLVAHSCLTHCDPMDCSPPGFSVHGILQARILQWVAMPFSRGSSGPRAQTQVSCTAGRFFTI